MLSQDEVIIRNGSMPANEAQSKGAPIEERVVKQVQALEAWYAAEFEKRLSALTEMLKMQLQIQIEELQQHYDRREKAILDKTALEKAALEKASLEKAQATVPTVVAVHSAAHGPEKLLEEIKRTEAVAQKCAAELERMVGDDSVNLGLLLQMRNHQLEVRAYLRGLKYGSEDGQAHSPTA
jgi:hypothetical protein